MDGFIKLHRKLFSWEWYTDLNTFKLWIHLLLRANYEDKNWKGETIKKGSFITSYQTLSNETGLSIQEIRTSLKKLKSTQDITQISRAKNTLIIINNYSLYQDSNTQSNVEATSYQQTINTLSTTNKNIKNIKNIKNNKEKEIYKEKDNCNRVLDLYHSLCSSYSKVIKLSDKRIKTINARFKEGYTIDSFETLFKKAESSNFLKGVNDRNWKADFDWLINPNNMLKVLEGKYDNKNNYTI